MPIRSATPSDIPAITAIYAYEVINHTATAEIDAPDEAEMLARFEKVTKASFPYFVYEEAGEVLGYAYAGFYHPRFGYRFCCEDSIYVAKKAHGQGIGSKLLEKLLEATNAMGMRQMMALIGGFENKGSILIHEKLGFKVVGHAKSLYWKHGKWVDLVLMQKQLGEGDSTDAA